MLVIVVLVALPLVTVIVPVAWVPAESAGAAIVIFGALLYPFPALVITRSYTLLLGWSPVAWVDLSRHVLSIVPKLYYHTVVILHLQS